MKYKIQIDVSSNTDPILLDLDDVNSPNTVNEFIKKLPFTVDLNVWGEEVYTSESPITQAEENSKPLVDLNDVAYWPTGKAICLFYGSTPIGKPGEITPASPVNVIGKIISPKKNILEHLNGKNAIFSLI